MKKFSLPSMSTRTSLNRATKFAFSTLGTFALLMACEPGDDGGDDGPKANIELEDDNNYESEAKLKLETIETATGGVDIEICWDEIKKNLQCHEVDAMKDIDNIAVVRFIGFTQKEIEERLAIGDIPQSATSGYMSRKTKDESNCLMMSEMTLQGTKIDLKEQYTEDSDRQYLLLATTGTTDGVGAQSLAFLKPTSDSTNTEVTIPSGCDLLEFSANLSDLDPVKIPKEGPWVVDWSKITKNSLGKKVDFALIDGILLGYYEGKSVKDLEERILDLEIIATDMWRLDLESGKKADLADTKHTEDDDKFEGFNDNDGTWILGLMCSKCSNPSPVVLTILEPE